MKQDDQISEKSDALTKTTGRAAAWQILGGAWVTVVRLVSSIFLARLLSPDDFGLYGMAVIVMELINCLGNLGMNAGIVATKDVTEEDLCTCFWSMAGVRTCLFLITFFGAPIASTVFDEARLTGVLQIVSFHFLISTLSVMSQTILVKKLEFRVINIITGCIALIESCLVIYLAWFTDLAYYSFAFAMLSNSIATSIFLFFYAGWYPKFIFSKKSFGYLFNFGIHGLWISISNYINQNIDYLLVGRMLGTHQLGLYEFAYRVPNIIYQRIAQPVGLVCFPAFSKVSDDNSLLFSGYIKATKFVCLLTFPMLIGMAALADIIVQLLWGNQWLSIIFPLQILCFCSALRCVYQTAPLLLYCKKKPYLASMISFISMISTFLLVAILGYYLKIIGVALGMLLSVIPSYALIFFVLKYTNKSINLFIKPLTPLVIATAICWCVAFLVKKYLTIHGFPIIITLCLAILFGAISYIVSIRFISPRLFFESIGLFENILGISIVTRFFKQNQSEEL